MYMGKLGFKLQGVVYKIVMKAKELYEQFNKDDYTEIKEIFSDVNFNVSYYKHWLDDFLDGVSSFDYTNSVEKLEEYIMELADETVPVYTFDIWEWFISDINNLDYLEEAVKTYSFENGEFLIGASYTLAKEEMFNIFYANLKIYVEKGDEVNARD